MKSCRILFRRGKSLVYHKTLELLVNKIFDAYTYLPPVEGSTYELEN